MSRSSFPAPPCAPLCWDRRDEKLLESEEPRKSEAFPRDNTRGFAFSTAAELDADDVPSPFSARFAASLADNLRRRKSFFVDHYGKDGEGENNTDKIETPDNADWRRIDDEWLFSAETLALRLTEGVNNTSLVLAFELPTSRKVLLFVGDAQRGNWYSWKDVAWQKGQQDHHGAQSSRADRAVQGWPSRQPQCHA